MYCLGKMLKYERSEQYQVGFEGCVGVRQPSMLLSHHHLAFPCAWSLGKTKVSLMAMSQPGRCSWLREGTDGNLPFIKLSDPGVSPTVLSLESKC